MITSDKDNILCILRILEEYSDEDHILSLKEILSKMETEYQRTVDRRTVYAAMDGLEEFGYDISKYSDNGRGYYLAERTFSTAEIRLLTDAVYSCRYISPAQTEELLKKLRSFLSQYDRKSLNYTNIIKTEKKSPNKEVFLNIELLGEAIDAHRQISFTYMDYDHNKKLVPRRSEKYVASPYSMICEGSLYYLVLIYRGQTKPGFYRIDMMKDIEILPDPIEISKREANLDSVKKVVYAHSGEPVRVTIKFTKKVLRYVIEEFGKDTLITDNGDGTFTADVLTAAEGLVYWALQYMQDAEIVSPAPLRRKIKEAIRANRYGV